MPITTNRAAAILRDAGLTRDRARRLLATGVAGAGLRTTGALLYDEEQVRALGRRPFLDESDVTAACPHGLLVGRMSTTRTVDITEDAASQRRSVSGPWRPRPGTRLLVRARCQVGVPMPFIATVSGYILVGAEVIAVEPDDDSTIRFELTGPGPWYDALRDRRWPTGRGGPALLLTNWQPLRNTAAGDPPLRPHAG